MEEIDRYTGKDATGHAYGGLHWALYSALALVLYKATSLISQPASWLGFHHFSTAFGIVGYPFL